MEAKVLAIVTTKHFFRQDIHTKPREKVYTLYGATKCWTYLSWFIE